jgi:urea transporter
MSNFRQSWSNGVERNQALQFLDMNLRGAGQVIFQNNPLTGLLFIIAVCWGAYAAHNIVVAVCAVLGLVVSTLTATLLDADRASQRQGLFGFNGFLVGVAVPTFLVVEPLMWFLLLIGASVSTVVMLAMSNVMKTWSVPALTSPFVLTTWFLVLAAYSFGHLPISSMGPPALPQPVAAAASSITLSANFLLSSWLKGPAQVFLINDAVAGVIVVIGLLVGSRWSAVFALIGSAVALLLAVLLGARAGRIDAGLYAFSPVLTAVALGSVFYKPSWRVALFALLGTIFTVIVQGALDAAIAPAGIPTFTAPFVTVTWLFLLPKANLQPHPHEALKDGILTNK